MNRLLIITELTRAVGGWTPNGYGAPAHVVFQASETQDYYPLPLSWRSFKLGSSDYDEAPDELYCPCGATVGLGDDWHVLGDFVEAAEDHITTKHPEARR
jgi:hypothetical protein